MSETGASPAGGPGPRWDFFLSYTAADRAWAEWVAWQLEEAGYRVLFQAWDFVAGSHWTSRMEEGITGAGHTLAILSRAYLSSVYGRAEWQAAYRADPRGLRRKLIPVRVEDCDRPGLLGEVVSFDLFGYPADAARQHLLDTISHTLAGRAKPATPPAFPTPTPPSDPPAAEPAFPGPAPGGTATSPSRHRPPTPRLETEQRTEPGVTPAGAGQDRLLAGRVFLCHSSGDKEQVRDLYRRLRQDGIQPWLDEEDILPGQDWQHEIQRAIRGSRCVLVCLSQGSVSRRGYVQKEIKQALDVADEQPEGSIFLIPVRFEPCRVPARLGSRQWVDLFAAGGYDRLLLALGRKRPPGTPGPAAQGRTADHPPPPTRRPAPAPRPPPPVTGPAVSSAAPQTTPTPPGTAGREPAPTSTRPPTAHGLVAPDNRTGWSRRRILLAGAIALPPALTGTVLTVVLRGGPTPPTTPGSGTKIVLGYSAWPGWFPWKVAEEKGLFAANGVNVELQWFDSYPESITALSSGAINANSQTLQDTLVSVSGGAEQVIVLTNDNSTGNDQIIAAEGITDVAGLKGKKIAVEQGYVDHFLLLLAFERAGLSSDDVEIVPLLTDQAAAAFKGGQVDAVGAYAPFTTVALERPGSTMITDSSDFPGAIPDNLAVSRRLVESNPEGIQGLVNTWFDTVAYIAAHRDEAIRIMAEQAKVSAEDYRAYDAGTTIFTREDNLKAFTPGNTGANLDYQAKKISTFLVDTGLAEKEPSLNGLFDPSFVQKAG